MSNNIADKISVLIRQAEESTHPEEAATFMAKVHSLLEKHGLNLLDLGRLSSDDPVGKSRKQAEFFASESFMRDVVFHLARYYGCRAIVHTVGNHRWATIMGRESARMTFTLMYPYVKKCIRSEARRLHKIEAADPIWAMLPKKARSSYAKQQRYVADALAWRLQVEVARRSREDKVYQARGVNALVPVDEIDAMVDAMGAKTARDRQYLTTKEAEEAAQGINLNQQMAGAKQKQIGKE